MRTNVTLDRSFVAIDLPTTVHLLLELTAPDAYAVTRPPLDIAVVLDRSGSMGGDPLHAVKEATCNLLRLLGPNDRMSVVTFDDAVDVVLPLLSHHAGSASRAVRTIVSGGSTNLSGGWLAGMQILQRDGRREALRRVVLLTDGHANAGITDREQLCTLVRAARRDGVTTTTVGFDDGYDEVLLAAIADAGAGNDYWCAGPDQAAQVFAAEFDGLAAVVVQNISVEFRAGAARPTMTVLNDVPVAPLSGRAGPVGAGGHVGLGDAYGGECRRLVLACEVPRQRDLGSGDRGPVHLGPVDLGTVVVRWASAVGEVALHSAAHSLQLTATADVRDLTRPLDPRVTEQVALLRAAHERKLAHERIARGDVAGAREALQQTVESLRACPGAAPALAQAHADLEQMAGGSWNAAASKRLFADQRSATKGRRSRFDGTPDQA